MSSSRFSAAKATRWAVVVAVVGLASAANSAAQTAPWDCPPQELARLSQREVEIRALRPREVGYLPRPFPRSAADVQANLAVSLAPRLYPDNSSLRAMKQAITAQEARVTRIWVVASWASPCLGKLDGRFNLVAEIRNAGGGLPLFAMFSPEGYWGGHAFPDAETPPDTDEGLARNFPDEAKVRMELAARWQMRSEKLSYFSSVVRPLGGSACSTLKPCVAFEEAGYTFVNVPPTSAPPHGVLFRAGETIELPPPRDPAYFEGPPALKVRAPMQWLLLEDVKPVAQ